MSARDDFTEKVKVTLAMRAGMKCSLCGKSTSGPHSNPEKALNIGVAAHISAAATGGPRFDESMQSSLRRSQANGIWLCQNCAKLVDSDESIYTIDMLKALKTSAEKKALTAIDARCTTFSQSTLRKRGIFLFNRNNPYFVHVFQSNYLSRGSFWTATTKYKVYHKNLIHEIVNELKKHSFYSIYGNSGRGKTYFIFDLINSIVHDYEIIYYSPNLDNDTEDVGSIGDIIKDILEMHISDKQRTIIIFDDAHLAHKEDIVNLVSYLNQRLSLILISRRRENKAVLTGALSNCRNLFKSFNTIAENTFDRLLCQFCENSNIKFTKALKESIESEIEGANLIFLSIMIHAWEELLVVDNAEIGIDRVIEYAYEIFLSNYKESPKGWQEIQNTVSALFQYELRIDERYLNSEYNHHFPKDTLQHYLKDRMIHDRVFTEDEERSVYYVFADFAKGQDEFTMRHASEYRFFLKASNGYLSFREEHNLQRIDFTKLVMKDYIKFNPTPKNISSLLYVIRQNSEKEEFDQIRSSIIDDQQLRSILIREEHKYLSRQIPKRKV